MSIPKITMRTDMDGKTWCKHPETTGHMWRDRSIGVKGWFHAFVQPGDVEHHDRVTCDDCGFLLPLGPSNDSHPDEISLAACLADTCILWEPGADREEIIGRYVEGFASQGKP